MDEVPTFLEAGPEGYETKRFSKLVWRQSITQKCQQELNRDTSDEEDPEKDKLKVFLRMRPLLGRERGSFGPFRISENERTLMVENDEVASQKSMLTGEVYQQFTFSKILPESSSQEDVYNTCMTDVMSSFLEESNCLLFCYGATNAGKTYTIQGSANAPGIIPRAVREIFSAVEGCQSAGDMLKPDLHENLIKLDEDQKRRELSGVSAFLRSHAERQKKLKTSFNGSVKSTTSSCDRVMSSTLLSGESGKSLNHFGDISKALEMLDATNIDNDSDYVYYVWMSCIEIYNEKISDLLVTYEHKKPRKTLKLVMDPKKGTVSVSGVKYIYVRNAEDTLSVMSAAADNISFASTRMNERSSRSHCLFSLKVIKSLKEKPFLCPRMSTVTFCDLAGSERTGKTGNEGLRLKETGSINTSLMVLGRCMRAIRAAQSSKEKRKVVIPYRESKLTQLLQSFFEGGGKVSMLVNICPSILVLEETLQVLKFSAIAQKIVTISREKEVAPVRESKPSMFAHRLSKFTGGKGSITWATPFKTHTSAINISPGDKIEMPDLLEEEEDEENVNTTNKDEWIRYANHLEKQIEQLKYKMKKQDKETREEFLQYFDLKIKEINKRHQDEVDYLLDRAETRVQDKLSAYERAQEQYKRERGEVDTDELQEELNLRGREIKNLEEENCEMKEMCNNLQKRMNDFSKEKQALMQEKMEMTFAITTLKDNLKEFQMANQLDSKLMEENERLEEQLQEATEKYLSMKARVETREEENRHNSKWINELRNENLMLSQEAEALQEQARGNTNMIEEYEVKTCRMEEENKKLKIKNALIERELTEIREEQMARQNEDSRLKTKQLLRQVAERSPRSPKLGLTSETLELKQNLNKAKTEIEGLNNTVVVLKKEIEALRCARERDLKLNELTEQEYERGRQRLETKCEETRTLKFEVERLKEELKNVKISDQVVNPFSDTTNQSIISRRENQKKSRRGRKQARKASSPPRTRSRCTASKENSNPSFLSEDDFVEPPKPAPRNRKLLDTYLPRYTGESSVNESITEGKKRNLRPRK